ncbi:MAG: hypothetical protein KGM92_02235, partial [Acidobacteriota bacterium]|nr:hypothetical protein [Acidobacteriota bacterium]
MRRAVWLAPAAVCLFAARLSAQDTTELLSRMKALEDRIHTLEAEVESLKSQQAVAPTAPPAQPVPVPPAPPPAVVAAGGGQLPVYGGAGAAASKVFNPDISVIGDFVGAAGNPSVRYMPSLEMHESEVGFQAIIDPYARGDFFLTFGEQGVDLEEGYITFTS